MRTPQQRSFAILFPTQVINKVDRIINIVHINSRISIRTDEGCEIHKITNHHKRITPQREF